MKKLLIALYVFVSAAATAAIPDNIVIKAQCTQGQVELIREDGNNFITYEPVLAGKRIGVYPYSPKADSFINPKTNETVYRYVGVTKDRKHARVVLYSDNDLNKLNVVFVTEEMALDESTDPKVEICTVTSKG